MLTFPALVTVRQMHLSNPRSTPTTDLQVHQAMVRLFSDEAGTIEVARQTVGPLTTFAAVRVCVVRVEIDRVAGRWGDMREFGRARGDCARRGGELIYRLLRGVMWLAGCPHPVTSRQFCY